MGRSSFAIFAALINKGRECQRAAADDRQIFLQGAIAGTFSERERPFPALPQLVPQLRMRAWCVLERIFSLLQFLYSKSQRDCRAAPRESWIYVIEHIYES